MIGYTTKHRLTTNVDSDITIDDLKRNLRIFGTEEFDSQLTTSLLAAKQAVEVHWLGTTIAVNDYSLSFCSSPETYLVQGDVTEPENVVVKLDGAAVTDGFTQQIDDSKGRRDVLITFPAREPNTELTVEAKIGFPSTSGNFTVIKQAVMLLASHLFNDPSAYSVASMNMNPAFHSLIGHLRTEILR